MSGSQIFFRCHLELYRVILISINFKMSRKYGVFIKWNGHQVIRKAPVTRNTQSRIYFPTHFFDLLREIIMGSVFVLLPNFFKTISDGGNTTSIDDKAR